MPIPRAVAVVVDGARVLLIKRYLRNAPPHDCPYCVTTGACPGHRYAVLPGGHVETGESAEVAAVRELAEETTLTSRIDRLLWSGEHYTRPAHYFLMADVTGTPVLSGSEAEAHSATNSFELRWAEPTEFESLNLIPPDIRAPLAALLQP